jgi:hypothetical protein
MVKLSFEDARQLAAEFQKKYSRFVRRACIGRIRGDGRGYICKSFGLVVIPSLAIEIDLLSVDDGQWQEVCYERLPPDEFTGRQGTIPIRYVEV